MNSSSLRAESLKETKPKAYEHEYLGIATGTGGQVFENVTVRPITEEEMARFDRIYQGLDFGSALIRQHMKKCIMTGRGSVFPVWRSVRNSDGEYPAGWKDPVVQSTQ